jgi:hypothetical protein
MRRLDLPWSSIVCLIRYSGGPGPFSGTLVHRGWKTERVKLARIVRVNADRLPTIAPAEVELK